MAVASKTDTSAVFALRTAAMTLITVALKTADLKALAQALETQFASTPALFDHDPVVVDLSTLRERDEAIDFSALVALLRRYKMLPVAAKGGSARQMADALTHGLSEAPEGTPAPPAAARRTGKGEPAPQPVATPAVAPAQGRTLIVDRPLRSGQQIYAKNCDLVVLDVVSFGAEVIADGSIHVYAPLRGRALAGARGDADARIFTTCMQPQLVAIAGIYRTTETELPDDVLGKPAQVRLDGDRLIVEALKA